MIKEETCTSIIEQLQLHGRNLQINLKTHCIEVEKSLIPSPTLYIAYKTGNVNVLSYHPGQIVIKKEKKNTTVSPFNHEHVKLYHEYLSKIWTPPTVTFNVFMPCTQKKPYRTSVTHRMMLHYIRMLQGKGLKTMMYSISEPMLLVPYTLELFYPLSNYEFPPKLMTEREKEIMKKLLAKLLPKFLKKAQYNVFVLPKHHAQIVLDALAKGSTVTEAKTEMGVSVHKLQNNAILFEYGRLAFKTISTAYRTMLKLTERLPKEF